jgi:hypothetical protein
MAEGPDERLLQKTRSRTLIRIERHAGWIRGRLLVGQRFQPTRRTQPIDVPLRENRAQPGRQTASTVKISKQALAGTFTLTHTKEIAVKGVGQLARTAAWIDRVGASVKERPELTDEVFPRAVITRGARACERQIFQVKGLEKSCDLFLVERSPGEEFCGAGLERSFEVGPRQVPPLGSCPAEQPFPKRDVNLPRGRHDSIMRRDTNSVRNRPAGSQLREAVSTLIGA